MKSSTLDNHRTQHETNYKALSAALQRDMSNAALRLHALLESVRANQAGKVYTAAVLRDVLIDLDYVDHIGE